MDHACSWVMKIRGEHAIPWGAHAVRWGMPTEGKACTPGSCTGWLAADREAGRRAGWQAAGWLAAALR